MPLHKLLIHCLSPPTAVQHGFMYLLPGFPEPRLLQVRRGGKAGRKNLLWLHALWGRRRRVWQVGAAGEA